MEKSIDYIIYGLIAVLIVFSLFVFLVKDTNTFSELTGHYIYDNGYDKFPIEEIRDDLTNLSRVTLVINDRPYYFDFRYGPKQLEDFPAYLNRNLIQSKQKYYITIDPYENLTGKTVLASLEISRVMSSKYLFNKETIGALTEEYNDSPVITCEDANETVGVIYFAPSDKNQMYIYGHCVIIEGKTEEDFIKGASKFGLYMLGVMRK